MHFRDGSWPSRFVFGRTRILEARIAELDRLVAAALASERAALDRLSDIAVPLISLSTELRVQSVNRRAASFLGRQATELVGKRFLDEVVSEPERARADAFYRRLLESGEAGEASLELPVLTDHGVRILGLRHSLERDSRGEIASVLCAGEDLTETYRALSELELLGRAIADTSDAIVVTDRLGVVTFVNPAFERITGRSRDDVMGKHARELFAEGAARERHREMLDAMHRGGSWAGRVEGRRANGEPYDEDTSLSPVRAAGGDVMGYVIVSRDVTEATKMQARLRMVERIESIRRLAGGIAHDFNNQLTVILGVCEMALPGIPEGSPLHRDLVDVFEAAQRAALLTGQLLAFGRLQVTQPEPIRLGEVLAEMRGPLTIVLGSEVALEIHGAPEAPSVIADKSHLEQVVLNLALNAKDAMPSGGTLSLRERAVELDATASARLGMAPGPCAVLEVRDTGDGMDPDTVSRIFEPFFTTKGLGQGTGLGLSTVYGIVQQAGGRLEVDSVLGVGTTFRIFLPAMGRADAYLEDEGASRDRSRAGSHTVLLVASDADVRDVGAAALRARGAHVLTAQNREQALTIAAGHLERVDVLVCEADLSDGHAWELAFALAPQRRGLPIVIVSRLPLPENLLSAEGLPEPVWLRRPFSESELDLAVRDALSGRAGARRAGEGADLYDGPTVPEG